MDPETITKHWKPYCSSRDLDGSCKFRHPIFSGALSTPHGIVKLDQWPLHLRMEVVTNGMAHVRVIKSIYQERFLITLAKRFAKEMSKQP